MDPFRLRIQKNLSALLETVTYQSVALTGHVYRGRNHFGEDDTVPAISILEAPLPLDQVRAPPDSKDSNGEWDLIIQGSVEDDKENPTDGAHVLMAEVKKILADHKAANNTRGHYDLLNMAGDVTGMYIGAGTVRPADNASMYAYFWLALTLVIAEDLGDPYA